jgi:hypothetical protein
LFGLLPQQIVTWVTRAEDHGRDGERELEPGIEVLLDEVGSSRDPDVAPTGRFPGSTQGVLDAVVDEVESGATRAFTAGDRPGWTRRRSPSRCWLTGPDKWQPAALSMVRPRFDICRSNDLLGPRLRF